MFGRGNKSPKSKPSGNVKEGTNRASSKSKKSIGKPIDSPTREQAMAAIEYSSVSPSLQSSLSSSNSDDDAVVAAVDPVPPIETNEMLKGQFSILKLKADQGGVVCRFCFDGPDGNRPLHSICACDNALCHAHLECIIDRIVRSQSAHCHECKTKFNIAENWYAKGVMRKRRVRLHNLIVWFVGFFLALVIFCAVGFSLAYAVRAVFWLFTRSFSYEIFGLRAGALPCPADLPVGGVTALIVLMLALVGKTTRDQCRSRRPCDCDCGDDERVYRSIDEYSGDDVVEMLQM